MRVEVKLLGALIEFLPDRGSDLQGSRVEVPDGTTLAEFIEHLAMPDNAEFFAFLNDDKVDEDTYAKTILKDGDEVILCAAIKGG